jgi:hypothetical protein
VYIDHFIELLIRSGLLGRPEADELVARFRDQFGDSSDLDDIDTFCQFLISENLFTNWQLSKLRAGKWKGFYLDNYLLLEQVGKDQEFCYYKGRDTRDGKLVRLVITPMVLSRSGGIEYRAERYPE